jgi:hypothetical protein
MTMDIAIQSPEPTLADVLRLLWRARRVVLAGGVVGLLGGLLFMTLAIPQYRATMLLAPTTRTGAPDISSLFPENASYAMEYVMKSFSTGDSSDFTWFEHILREPSVAAQLLKDPAIREGVAADRRFRIFPGKTPETPEDLAAYLNDHLTVEPVGNTQLRRLVYDHPDREFAKLMLQTVYAVTDSIIRADMKDKADKRVIWLQKTIQETQNPDHRKVLTSLLMDQEQIRMILSLDEPYAARIAEPPSVTTRQSWPHASLILPVFTTCGLLLGMVLFGMRRAFATL